MRTKLLSAAAACAALFLLTGCGGNSTDEASGENADTCTAYAAANNEFVGLVQAGPSGADGVEAWTASKNAALGQFTSQSEQATGEVKNALTTLVSDLPADSLELSEPDSESGKKFVDNSAAVAAACEADGTSLTVEEFPLLSF